MHFMHSLHIPDTKIKTLTVILWSLSFLFYRLLDDLVFNLRVVPIVSNNRPAHWIISFWGDASKQFWLFIRVKDVCCFGFFCCRALSIWLRHWILQNLLSVVKIKKCFSKKAAVARAGAVPLVPTCHYCQSKLPHLLKNYHWKWKKYVLGIWPSLIDAVTKSPSTSNICHIFIFCLKSYLVIKVSCWL